MARLYSWTGLTSLLGGASVTRLLYPAKVASSNPAIVKQTSALSKQFRGSFRAFRFRYQRLCRVEQLEHRALLTGGLSLGDFGLDAGSADRQHCAVEMAVESPRAEVLATQASPPPYELCLRGSAADSAVGEIIGPAELTHTAAAGTDAGCEDGAPDSDTSDAENSVGDVSELKETLCDCKKDSENSSPVTGDNPESFGTTTDHDRDAQTDPTRADLTGAPAHYPSVPKDDSASPMDSPLTPWQSTSTSAAEETMGFDEAAAANRRTATDQVFHYFESASRVLGPTEPRLSSDPLGRQTAHDTFVDFALLPAASHPALAARSGMASVPTPEPELPASRMIAASPATANPATASPATVARALEVVRSIDAVLAELNTDGLPPDTTSETVSGKPSASSATASATTSSPHSGEDPAVANHGPLRLGCLALGSLVLSSRRTPFTRGLAAARQARRWLRLG